MKRLVAVTLFATWYVLASTIPNPAPGVFVATNIQAVAIGEQVHHASAATFLVLDLGATAAVTIEMYGATVGHWTRTIDARDLPKVRNLSILPFPTTDQTVKVSVYDVGPHHPRIYMVPLERFQRGAVSDRGRVVRK